MVPAPALLGAPGVDKNHTSHLRSVLLTARPDWWGKDLTAVEDKLYRVGITNVPELILALRSRSLNDTLQRHGERRFTSDTLLVLSTVAEESMKTLKGVHFSSLREEHGGGPSAEPPKINSSRQELCVKRSFAEMLAPEAKIEEARQVREVPSAMNDFASKADIAAGPFLSLANVCRQLKLRGLAPVPGGNREDQMSLLKEVLAWDEMSSEELREVCKLKDLPVVEEAMQTEILQMLHRSTWDAWGIPVDLFESMTVAFGVLEQVENLVSRSLPELMSLAKRKGLKIGREPDAEVMLARLRNVAVWEHLPIEDLHRDCEARGLPSLKASEDHASTSPRGWFSSIRAWSLGRERYQPERKELIRQLTESDWANVAGPGMEALDDPQALGLLDDMPEAVEIIYQDPASHQAPDIPVGEEGDTNEDASVWPGYHQFLECIQQCANLGVMDRQLDGHTTSTWFCQEPDDASQLRCAPELAGLCGHDFTDFPCYSQMQIEDPEAPESSPCGIVWIDGQPCIEHFINLPVSETSSRCLPLKGIYGDYSVCIDQVDLANLQDSQVEYPEADVETAFEHAQCQQVVDVETDSECLICAQCNGYLPGGVEIAEDGHMYCDQCWQQFLENLASNHLVEDTEDGDEAEVNEWLRKWRANRGAIPNSEDSPRPMLIVGPSVLLPPIPALPNLPHMQPTLARQTPKRIHRLTPLPTLSPEPMPLVMHSGTSSPSSAVTRFLPSIRPITNQIVLPRLPALLIPTLQLPALVSRMDLSTSSRIPRRQSCANCQVSIPQLPNATMAERGSSQLRLVEMSKHGTYDKVCAAGFHNLQAVARDAADTLAIPLTKVATSDHAVQAEEPADWAIPVRFLYSSPLLIGNQALALNVRADLESLCAAEGIHAEVRVATVGCLREALVARTGPEILHISAHCMNLGGALSLVLEDTGSAAHPIPVSDLPYVGPWDGVGLLVLLACNSELCVQRLLQTSGLRRAVCCSATVLDRAAHLFCKTLYHALGAGHDLMRSFDIAKAAVRSSPEPCLQVEAGKFQLLGDVILSSTGQVWSPMPSNVMEQGQVLWPPWPRVEDFVGRESVELHLAAVFEQRRAICLWGSQGAGKTALCTEFCRHFSAPGGRRFSARVLLIDYARAVSENPGPLDAALSFAILTEMRLRGLTISTYGQDSCPSSPSHPRGSLVRAARELDEGGPWLLVVDGLAHAENALPSRNIEFCSEKTCAGDTGAGPQKIRCTQSSFNAVHSLLADLLQESAQLCVLLTARSPPRGLWSSLGPSKVVEIQLPSLKPEDMARLLARRAGRPFFYRDFNRASAVGPLNEIPLRLDPELIGLISRSPLGQLLGGNPGRIIRAAADVHSELPSLLGHPWLRTLPHLMARAVAS